ncbi:RNA-binding protein [Mesorhizobium sp. M4B.F.Ca.ET.215.01.1.1]|nr:RNA-binding protein [Mesorhizobium sp. M4B.F.Ca.ET.058.02.1.1]RUW25923.1 RNA-binding protein [Mesorhizobium sp. M4B.F.Ca.ET.013.02.1.1]RUW78637.1 RNA-binding protein [Mesorhizobium sp. M4B.F.Ca.ET.049.02.1.2]RVD44161.1 RNA-binding protein [Mesorhizobium sp. M4A.F.Ca.ET.020.02.1.1]RVD45476.1 RNA-binding protein [Mesorhizobium sp. M4B.F.Ca.ET.019.03.1.1]RVD73893.1 RNA-binding protein [Mesorhizobium sp. M4A.F.Ca.ET.029.04.2.1]RWC22579.1 MAG: RNA-binding protein [Mesorhizobium sp.]RWX58696.1 
MPLSCLDGILVPSDLELLQRVFDRLCDERRLAQKDKEQREDLAAEIVSAFRNGIADETELLRAISKRLMA